MPERPQRWRLTGRLGEVCGGHHGPVLTPDLAAHVAGAHLELLAAGAALPVRAWGEAELDEALAREGWRRTGPWTTTGGRRAAAVVPTYLDGSDGHDR